MAESKSELDLAFEEFENDCGTEKVIRREMIENLRKTMNNPEMQISPYDKSIMIQSKLMVIKTLDDILKSSTDISLKKLKMKLARKDNETNGMVGQTIVNLFKSIRVVGEPVNEQQAAADQAAAKEALKQRIEGLKSGGDAKTAAALEVSEGELISCGAATTTVNPEDRPPDEKEDD